MARMVVDEHGITHLVKDVSPLCNEDRIVPEDEAMEVGRMLAPHRLCLPCVDRA